MGGQGRCERRMEVFFLKRRSEVLMIFFLGGGRSRGGGGSGWGVRVDVNEE